MTEFSLVLMGVILAACGGLTGFAWHLAREARISVSKAKRLAASSLEDLRRAAADIAESHNELALTQVEQGKAIERLGAEAAGRTLRR